MYKEGDILEVGFFLLSLYFESPKGKVTKMTMIYRVICVSSILTMIALGLCNFILESFEVAIQTLEICGTGFHVLTKYLFFAIFRNTFQGFINTLDTFPTLDDASPDLKAELQQIYKYVYKFLVGLSFSTFCTLFSFFFKVITERKTSVMLVESWLPNDGPIFASVTWCLQCYTLTAAGVVVVGFDCTFASLCTHIYVQLRILEERYRNLSMPFDDSIENDKATRQKLASFAEHHLAILEFFNKLRSIYSPIYVLQFFSTSISACTQLYIFNYQSTIAEEITLMSQVNKMLYIFILLFEFGFYCVPADFLTSQLQNLCDAIYHSPWYESKLTFRKDLMIIMVSAQRSTAFTAGGFTDVSMATYTAVFKISFSFFTMMRSIME